MNNETKVNKPKVYGYARVSTVDQKTDNQIVKLEENGCQHIFQDKESGTKENMNKRLQFQSLLDTIAPGDTVMITKLDRLSRGGIREVLNILNEFKEAEVNFVCIDTPYMSIDYSKKENITPINELFISMVASFAEMEWNLIKERRQEGINRQKANGTYTGGRRAIPKPDNFDEVIKECYRELKPGEVKKMTAEKAMKILGLNRTTFYKMAKGNPHYEKHKLKNQNQADQATQDTLNQLRKELEEAKRLNEEHAIQQAQ